MKQKRAIYELGGENWQADLDITDVGDHIQVTYSCGDNTGSVVIREEHFAAVIRAMVNWEGGWECEE